MSKDGDKLVLGMKYMLTEPEVGRAGDVRMFKMEMVKTRMLEDGDG